jgi:hypothetical protein
MSLFLLGGLLFVRPQEIRQSTIIVLLNAPMASYAGEKYS